MDRKFKKRTIDFEGVIITSSAEEMEIFKDTFKKNISQKEAFLTLKFGNEFRKARATQVKDQIFNLTHSDITRCPFSLSFQILDPFWETKEQESYTFPNTTGILIQEINNSGTAETDIQLYISFNEGSDVQEIRMKQNGKLMTIVEQFNEGDLLAIDGINVAVLKNGIDVDYI
ncbi:MAG: phage tail family protein [Candidatus Peribacteria bacterium]|nr:phage tail family protein [Candidatus Peribacteria bacterium]